MIEIKNLKKSYLVGGKDMMVLKGINLKVKGGGFIAIMGPSGSGKSTLMNMIGILDIPTSGDYFFEGTNVADFTEDEQATFRRDEIGFIFQGYNLLPRLSAWHQVALPLAYKGWGFSRKYKRAVEALKEVGLGEKINSTPDMLSGGEQQRVCIARALACDPSLLLADEPTGALDSVTGKDLLKLFKKLNKSGKTIIMITHDPDVASYAKRVVHIKDGLIDKIVK